MKISQISRLLAKMGGAVAIVCLSGVEAANALDFTFSFSNVTGSVPGTVTGTLGGLNDNATGAATSLELTSFPAGLGTLEAGNNVLAWSFQSANSFTVTNGSITAANFFATDGISDGLCLNTSCFAGLSNALTLDTASTNTGNNDGFSGVTFAAAGATPVPFEVNPTLGLLLVAGLFSSNRLYRKHKGRKI
ncbi:MAG: hypothetical protein QNJ60_11095 [Xenococcaceae cyanobacterium MO_188.B19]|nr:hypothetical protein [Xenococcaceae cyanobacterium MO_188.B19]